MSGFQFTGQDGQLDEVRDRQGARPWAVASDGRMRAFGDAFDRVVTSHLQGAAGVTAANYGQFFIADRPYEVTKVDAIWRTPSSSGTLQVERLQGVEAKGAGDDLLTGTISIAGTAETVTAGTLIATKATLRLDTGDRL